MLWADFRCFLEAESAGQGSRAAHRGIAYASTRRGLELLLRLAEPLETPRPPHTAVIFSAPPVHSLDVGSCVKNWRLAKALLRLW